MHLPGDGAGEGDRVGAYFIFNIFPLQALGVHYATMSAGNISEMVDMSTMEARSKAAGRTGVRRQALVYEGPEDDQSSLHKSTIEGNANADQVCTRLTCNRSPVA